MLTTKSMSLCGYAADSNALWSSVFLPHCIISYKSGLNSRSRCKAETKTASTSAIQPSHGRELTKQQSYYLYRSGRSWPIHGRRPRRAIHLFGVTSPITRESADSGFGQFLRAYSSWPAIANGPTDSLWTVLIRDRSSQEEKTNNNNNNK